VHTAGTRLPLGLRAHTRGAEARARRHWTSERGAVPGAQAGAILPGGIGSIARGCAEGIGPRSHRETPLTRSRLEAH